MNRLHVGEHEQQAKSDQHLFHRSGCTHAVDQRDVQQRAANAHRNRREQIRPPHRSGDLHDAVTEKGAECVQRAVREIDEVQQSENDGQTNRQQKQQHGKLQGVEDLNQPEAAVCEHVINSPERPAAIARARPCSQMSLHSTQPFVSSWNIRNRREHALLHLAIAKLVLEHIHILDDVVGLWIDLQWPARTGEFNFGKLGFELRLVAAGGLDGINNEMRGVITGDGEF